MFLPIIASDRGRDQDSMPDLVKLDPDEEFVRAYSPASIGRLIAVPVGLTAAFLYFVFKIVAVNAQLSARAGIPSLASLLTKNWWWIFFVLVFFVVFHLKYFSPLKKLSRMSQVYLTTKALIFKQKGIWVALPLTDVIHVARTGILGNYEVLVFGNLSAKPTVRISTESPNYVVEEIVLYSNAAKGNGKRQRL
jgi:hypothetical protein